jgi:hypothetical protein
MNSQMKVDSLSNSLGEKEVVNGKGKLNINE